MCDCSNGAECPAPVVLWSIQDVRPVVLVEGFVLSGSPWGGTGTRTATADADTADDHAGAIALASYARAVLYNGLGRYHAALGAARRACARDAEGVLGWALTELIEAGVRGGDLDVAAASLRRLEQRTPVGATGWALGIKARSRALLCARDEADALYRQALDLLAGDGLAFQRARTQLLYGEWLRREGRRVDARGHLRAAHRSFDRMLTCGFARRAERELAATGETVRKRSPGGRDDLTPQEAEIARLAGEGYTNPEIGTRMFLSARTVEWHLRKVFAKLGIGSRRQLRRLLPDAVPA
jgi:DNA-binding CsgD family transcriptional regulator